MKKFTHLAERARLLGPAAAIALLASCSYGIVEDPSGNLIPGAFVSFRGADLSGTSTGPVTLGSSSWVFAWSPGDPGSNGNSGIFYLNPWGTLNSGDTRTLFTGGGWMRIFSSKAGYDSRFIYHNRQFTSCDIADNEGPYSAGPYPYDESGAKISGICAFDAVVLRPSNTNYIKDPDMIVDARTLRDNVKATGADCEGVASTCLRISVGTANVGEGDLWLVGNSDDPNATKQRRFFRNGGFTETALPNAVFLYHPAHGHIHLQNWTNLRLRHVTSSCNTEATATNCPVVGSPGTKISFCLTDLATFDTAYSPNQAYGCTFDTTTHAISQGIGSGHEDIYNRFLEGQVVGTDGLASGTYWLEVEVNPANANGQRTVVESDYSNNITRIQVTL
jgi:hypothetical protein